MKTKPWALVLVLLCTICTSVAVIFNKKGATLLGLSLKGTILNYYLIAGLLLLITGAILLIFSLKGGDVTVIYPVIATSYIWASILSAYFFQDIINHLKIIGIGFIILGVVIINIGQKNVSNTRTGS